MKRIKLLILSLLLCATQVGAREVYDISRNWKFFTYNERDSLMVNLPHTWNNDAMGGRKDYYRGIGNYLRYIEIKPEWRHKRVFIKFDGANSVTDLMVNGKFVGEHKGGNNAFVFEITDYVNYSGKNLFWVVVNNAARVDVLPTASPENAYGGLFRGAELIVTDAVTMGLDQFGADGIMFRTLKITEDKAEGVVNVKLNSTISKQVKLDLSIMDVDGAVVSESTLRPKAEKGLTEVSLPFEIESPFLWNGRERPYLYNVTVTLTDGKNVDKIAFKTGIRSFSAHPFDGFSLNGVPYPLKAVVLYRDRATYGPVSLDAQIREDIDLICEMGANAVRVAGGTHSQEFYRQCDERGLIVLADAPFVGAASLESKGFYDTKDFRENGKMQLKEMVYQLYNHPSVCMWGIFSEPELRGDDPISYVKELNSIAKALDPSRLTVGISNRDGEVNTITDMIIWNHTFGWVEGRPADIGIWRDQIHADPVWNKTRSAVSWRCGGSIHQQSPTLRRSRIYSNWHPENWQTYLHEVYLGLLNDDTKFWGLFVGNMFDYGSVRYTWGEGTGINDTGVVTYDRQTKKDAFYLYKANWNDKDKFVYIAERRRDVRDRTPQTIKVFSNLDDVQLVVNGISYAPVKGKNGVFKWENVQLHDGDNTIVATGDVLWEDKVVIRVMPEMREQR